MHIYIKDNMKYLRSKGINYNFNMETGYMETWGETLDHDPDWSPHGPLIWDCEVSEQCHGIPNENGVYIPCPFCYKGNVGNKGRNMSFETFKTIFDKIPKTLTQVAFGIGDFNANYQLPVMMDYCRQNNVIPNITINGSRMTDNNFRTIAYQCGAASVSYYGNKDICYNAIAKLNWFGLKQTNIHVLLSKETLDWCYEVVKDSMSDPRLGKLNAIVFLALKQKGRGVGYSRVSDDDYKQLIKTCLDNKIRFGFDSCGANKFSKVATELGRDDLNVYAEPCESSGLSMNSNVEGKFFPCSFAEDVTEGISIVDAEDFIQDVWMNKLTICERNRIIENKRSCPYFEV